MNLGWVIRASCWVSALAAGLVGCSSEGAPTSVGDASPSEGGGDASTEGGSSLLDAAGDRGSDPLTCSATTQCKECRAPADCRACCESFQCADPSEPCPAFDDCRARCK